MRLRTALLSLASALTLTLSVSTSAYAEAEGKFLYEYTERGVQDSGKKTDPDLNECYDVVASADSDVYALDPNNDTDANADLYPDLGCEGTKVATLGPKSESGVHFRSVRFRAVPPSE
ncbi:hypothetical protein AB0A70_27650 [Streptomyces morookaense]|uniref:hypothetical protein n=1 Tax=Streptomyces morookaense TaxID=1970 RepID=UPI0033ED1DF7